MYIDHDMKLQYKQEQHVRNIIYATQLAGGFLLKKLKYFVKYL